MDYQFTEEEIQNEILKIKEEEQFKERVDKVVKNQMEEFESSFESLQKQFLELKLELSKKDDIIESLDKRIKVLEDDKEKLRLERIQLFGPENKTLADAIFQARKASVIASEKFPVIQEPPAPVQRKQRPKNCTNNVGGVGLEETRSSKLQENEDSILEDQIRKFFTEEKEKYIKEGKLWICKHAVPKRPDHGGYGEFWCITKNFAGSGSSSNIKDIISNIISELFTGYESLVKGGYCAQATQPCIWDLLVSLFWQPFMKSKFKDSLEKACREWQSKCSDVHRGFVPTSHEHFFINMNALPEN